MTVQYMDEEPTEAEPKLDRECGTCYACCVWLDITELHKKGGRPCKFLKHQKPTERCSIYKKRPVACSGYHCMWLTGCFGSDMRPDISGLLATMYNDPENDGKYLVTINITNGVKAGSMNDGPLGTMLHWLLTKLEHCISRINLVNRRTGAVIEFSDGVIWQADLIKGTKLEELTFLRSKVIGHYKSADPRDIVPGMMSKDTVVLR